MMPALLQSVITDLLFCNNFPTFVVEIDKGMETAIIRIGNSRGIIIPSAILKKYGVKEGDKVRLEKKEGDTFTLSFVSGEDSYTGPFTGMFKELAKFKDMEDPWGDDPVEYVRKLRDDSNVEKRELPDI